MLIILNIVILIFLLGMIAIWSTYGFFSAFMNLVIVIASGVFAFAMWEPLSYMLLGRMPGYAHGVGLLAPFALAIIILRVAFDKACRMNVHVPRLADQIGGAACGLLTGILAVGMLLNAANFMPIAREAFGWVPYEIKGAAMVESRDGGKLWLGVDKWSAGFFSLLSNGSMSPITGPSLANARPDLAKRAAVYRLTEDENQMRSASPKSVNVTGVFAVPATEEALRAIVERSTVTAFLAPGYKPPAVEAEGEAGSAFVDTIFKDYANRHADAATHGQPSEMLNLEAVLATAQIDGLGVDNPTTPANFRILVRLLSARLGDQLVEQMKGALTPEARLYFVDTKWSNDSPGTYNSDSKLRVALTQIQLQTRDKKSGEIDTLSPVGFSLEYNQNSGARTFTEAVSRQRYVAYSPYDDVQMGWAFVLPNSQEPEYFFARELRFDLAGVPNAPALDTPLNQSVGAAARVAGSPMLPKAPAEGEKPKSSNTTLLEGVQIAATGSYADISGLLPMTFSNSTAGMESDKGSDPYTLISGKGESLPRARGGNKNSIREVYVDKESMLIRVKLSDQSARSLYGQARGLAAALGIMQVKDQRGKGYDAIGYALLDSNNELTIDIRKEASQGGLSASELPNVKPGETLFVYFQVPKDSQVQSYLLGGNEQPFETPLVLEQ